MDGESIWAIRKNGWLELGYNIKYFQEALKRFGYEVTENVGNDGPWSRTLVAKRITKFYEFRFGAEPLKKEIGSLTDKGLNIKFGERGFASYGPYHMLHAGKWRVTVSLVENTVCNGEFILDVVDNFGSKKILSPFKFSLVEGKVEYTAEFVALHDLKNFEIRTLIFKECEATFSHITFKRLEDSHDMIIRYRQNFFTKIQSPWQVLRKIGSRLKRHINN